MTPPKAGPTARLTLTPTLFAATASGKSCLGTSCGTIDCQRRGGQRCARLDEERQEQQPAWRDEVQPNERRKRRGTYRDEGFDDNQQAALVNDVRKRTRQQREQEGWQARCHLNQGTATGFGSSVVMSHAEAALYIQPPRFETTVAVHRTVNAR